jgi:gas vesicle protein
MVDKKKTFGLGIVLGAVLGGVGALLLNPQTGKENREAVVKKMKELKKKIEEGKYDEKVKEIFGEVTANTKKMYLSAKEQLVSRLADVHEMIKDIDKNKYLDLVDEVVREVKKESKYSEKVIDRLKDNLAEDWNKIIS